MSTISSFKYIENKHDAYRGKEFMKKFCESLKEYAKKIIKFKKKKMKLLRKEQQESYENAKICFIYREKFEEKYAKDKKYRKARDHFHYTGECRVLLHSIWNLKYTIPKEITIIFYDGSNYNYYFIIKELAEKFKGDFTCLGENTEKYISFSVPIEKEIKRIGKYEEQIRKTIS